MNILKQIQLLVLILAPVCLMGMEQCLGAAIQPIQSDVLSAVELGVKMGIKEFQKDFQLQVSNGGLVTVRVDTYEYGCTLNSLRDKNRDAEISASEIKNLPSRYKISVHIDGVRFDSLEWLKYIFNSEEPAKLFFQKWLYTLSIHNSGITMLSGSWFCSFKNLETLDLSKNNITGFDATDFGLPNTLQSLNLSENNITVIPTPLFSQRLPWMERLNLSKNHINTLSPRMFSGLVLLNSLNLSNNDIVILPDNVFYKVGEIYNFFRLSVNLCNNPILSTYRQVNMHRLGFSKRSGNKVVFDCIDDGRSTPRNIYLEL